MSYSCALMHLGKAGSELGLIPSTGLFTLVGGLAVAPMHLKSRDDMLQHDWFPGIPELDYEGWRDALRPHFGRYDPVVTERKAFTGRARPRNLWGLVAMDLSCNAHRVERTERDVRHDGVDHYFALFQVAGASTIIQNDQVVQLDEGDAALVDSAQPGRHVSDEGCGRWISLQLPRRSLVSHLGFDPRDGVLRRGGTAAGRALFDLVRDADIEDGSRFSPADSYTQLAVYDLIGALLARSRPMPVSPYADKLFKLLCDIVRANFANPAFGPCEVAAEAGISLRYLQKLFTAQNSTCSHFISSVRLDHAARLLQRRKLLGTSLPLSEIAYTCGFADYTNFARQFRRRFGHAPGSYSGEDGRGIQAKVGSVRPQ
jgi:AraC family transcriptional activator of tynA and feaB